MQQYSSSRSRNSSSSSSSSSAGNPSWVGSHYYYYAIRWLVLLLQSHLSIGVFILSVQQSVPVADPCHSLKVTGELHAVLLSYFDVLLVSIGVYE